MSKRLTYEEVKYFVENNSECKLKSDVYINAKESLIFECKCGNIFETIFDTFKSKNKRQCNECSIKESSQKKSLDYEYIKNYIENKGYKLLSEEYINAQSYLIVECSNNHRYKVTWNAFQQGERCAKCFGNKKYSYDEVKCFIEIESKSGCKLLSNHYINSIEKIYIQCNCGNKFYTSFDAFKYGNKRQCNDCGYENINIILREDGKKVFNYFIEKGYTPEFSPDDYINSKQKLSYICNKHIDKGVQYITYDSLKSRGCFYCGIEKNSSKTRLDGEFVYNLFIQKGYIPLFDKNEYKNNNQKLKFICPKHEKEIQETSYILLTKNNNICKPCILENKSGKNNPSWKGGITPLQDYLRDKTKKWSNDSFKKNHYRCGITGEKSSKLVIHHLYGFNIILSEVLNELNLEVLPEINLYTDEQLKNIEILLINKHYEYGFGIPLLPEVHEIFHSKEFYGKGNNTLEQFEDFKKWCKDNPKELNEFIKQRKIKDENQELESSSFLID